MTNLKSAKITLKMQVPYQQRIRIKLPLLETFKQAWIQYFSFFILGYFIIYEVLLGYAFKHNILETSTISEIHKINKNYLVMNPAKKLN